MNRIDFENRNGYNVWAEEVEPCRWLIKHNLPEWATWRIIGEPNDIMAIDPMGGPFISVGEIMNNDEQITGIEPTNEGWILRTK